jgi:predicted acyltransferase
MFLADIVFPLFLFWVGMSVPLALDGRHRKGESDLSILTHIIKRTAGLVIIGILMVNVSSLSPEMAGIDRNLWAFLMYVGVILSWRVSGNEISTHSKIRGRVTHYTGIALLLFLTFIFRTEDGGWLTPKWWGILGLIGWAYLVSALAWLFFRTRVIYLWLIFVGLILYHALYWGVPMLKTQAGWLSINAYGGHAVLTYAGMMTTLVMKKYRTQTRKCFTIWGVAGSLFFLSAFLFRPFGGIEKNYATPSWVWLSIAIGLWTLIPVWWLTEVKKRTRWAVLFEPAGTQTFLAYLLPSLWYHLIWFLGITYPIWLTQSWGGLLRAVIFSVLMIQLTGLLSRWGIKLRL